MELDKDLAARQEARAAAKAAKEAQHILADMKQEQLDAIVEAVARAFAAESGMLAELAVPETGFGKVEDKVTKNLFASRDVEKAVREMKTVGLLREDRAFFSLKLCYDGTDTLIHAALDGQVIA